MSVRARTFRFLGTLMVAAVAGACGSGGPASPTPPPAAVATVAAAPASAGLPATFDPAAIARALPGLDLEYVRVLVYTVVTNTAEPGPERPLQRWPAGVPMRHCAGEGVPLDVLEQVAGAITEATGIPRAEAGPCTVEWSIDGSGGAGYSETVAPGHVRLVFHSARTMDVNAALHELGHAVGLGHSPRRGDLMFYQSNAGAFSAGELQVLGLMYGR